MFLFGQKPPEVNPFGPAGALAPTTPARAPSPAPRPAQTPAASTTPVAAGDSEPSIREHYQAQSYAALGLTEDEFNGMDPVERNTLISGAYADLYTGNPDTMKWAGMASFASDTVGLGMMGAGAMDLIPGGPDGDRLREALAQGNGQLFQDIHWQHLAFQQGGMEELTRAAEAGEVDPQQLAAWATIAQGQEALTEARASGDEEAIEAAQNTIWAGNGDLLGFEQKVFLQNLVYNSSDENRDTFQRMTNLTSLLPGVGMPSPIPGGESFQGYRDRTDADGRADVGNIDQRWDWIANSMLPSFRDLEENRPAEMQGYMQRFHDNAGSSTPGLPQIPRLTGALPGLPRMGDVLKKLNPFDNLF